MKLIYVTGTPGSGKSTILKELQRLGYEAYDVDDPKIGSPYNKASRKRTVVPPAEQRPPKWFDEHTWKISREALIKVKACAEGNLVFLCGTSGTDSEVWDLFDKVLFLNIDETTLRLRLEAREDNNFGKSNEELSLILARFTQDKERYKRLGVTSIDASQPIEKVAQKIISVANSSN